jgi:serine/threonine protein kinase
VPIADALSEAHRSGITHRDLKPANIMIRSEGRVKILDFGLAKLQETDRTEAAGSELPTMSVTMEGKIVGTVGYMSPEQAEGKAVDHRSDIFSLGILLYEMITGRQLFRGDTRMSVLSSIIKDEPQPVTAINQDLPHHLSRIIGRCLAKEPDLRYQSTQDLRNELDGLQREVASGAVSAAMESATSMAAPKTSRSWKREEERQQQREMIESLKLAGFITMVAGIGVMIFLYFLLAERTGSEKVFLVGLIPLLVGAGMLVYALVLAPKPEQPG